MSSKDLKVRVAVMKTLSVLAMIMMDQLENHIEKFIPHIQNSATEGNNDMMTYSLQILKKVFKSTEDPTNVSGTA